LDAIVSIRAFWLGQPPILPAFYPFGNSIFFSNGYRQDRELVTQYPSFSAMNGAIQSVAGSYIYTEHRDSLLTYLYRRYQGLDIPPPPGTNYDIGYDDFLTISTMIQIGPTVSKPLTMIPATRASLQQDPRVQFDIPTPIENFEGGLIYSKFTGISTFYDDAYIFGGLVAPFISSSFKKYLRLENGTEQEIKFSTEFRNYADNYIHNGAVTGTPDLVTWRTGEGAYPTLRDIGGLPDISSQYVPAASPLLKEKYTWTVVSIQPINDAGVIDYSSSTAFKTEKLVKTYAVTLAKTLTDQKILNAS
jgi:hypothetical protein